MQYDAQRGDYYLWENTLRVFLCVCVCVCVCACVCVVCLGWVGVSANLQCMHIFEIDHMFVCVKPEEQCASAAYL